MKLCASNLSISFNKQRHLNKKKKNIQKSMHVLFIASIIACSYFSISISPNEKYVSLSLFINMTLKCVSEWLSYGVVTESMDKQYQTTSKGMENFQKQYQVLNILKHIRICYMCIVYPKYFWHFCWSCAMHSIRFSIIKFWFLFSLVFVFSFHWSKFSECMHMVSFFRI